MGMFQRNTRETLKGIKDESEWKPPTIAPWQPPERKPWQPPGTKAIIPANPDGSKPEIVEFPESWPGVKFTESGLVFDDGENAITYDDWVKLGRWLGAINRRSKLWVADWLMHGERRQWGNTYTDLIAITGLEYETLKSYVAVGRAVPMRNRILGPQTSKYAAVMSLAPRDQLAILKRAKAEDWTRDDIRAAVKDKQRNNTPAESADPFAEDMAAMADLVVRAQPDEDIVTVFVVPESTVFRDDYYGALRDMLPDTAQAGEEYDVIIRRRR